MHNDIQDFKKTIEFLVEKHKALTLQLTEEKKFRAKCEILEFELKQQKLLNDNIKQKNFMIREKYLKLVEFIQRLYIEEDKIEQDEEDLVSKLVTENRALKEILNLNKISDPRFTQLEEFLKESEKSVALMQDFKELNYKEEDLKLEPSVIEEFKRDRAAMFSNLKTMSSEDINPEKKELKLFFSNLSDSSSSNSEGSTPTMAPKGEITPKSSDKT